MTNLVPTNIQVPAHIQARMAQGSALTNSLAGGLPQGAGAPRISLKGSRFRIVEDGVETVLPETQIDVVIVGANPQLSKTWYASDWKPDAEPTAPDCFSLNGISPDPESTMPQHDLCASCPHNAWGSKVTPNGMKVKACSDLKRLAVVAADDPAGTVYLLTVTPAALKGLNEYQKQLSQRSFPVEAVRTRLSFDTNASFPKLQFGFGGFLDEESAVAVEAVVGTPGVLDVTGEARAAAPAPAPAPAPSKPVLVKPAPAPAPEPVAAVKGFGKKAAAEKPAAAPVAAIEPKTIEAEAAPVAPTKAFNRKAPIAEQAAAVEAEVVSGGTMSDEIADLLAEMGNDDE